MTSHATDRLFRIAGSRIRNLYLELPDYEFFHGPSGMEKKDKRFVGRREVIDRIKRLLTDHAVASGAYLVTGYRGVGKSSAVATALSEVSVSLDSDRFSRYLRVFAMTLALLILTSMISPPLGKLEVGLILLTIAVAFATLMEILPRPHTKSHGILGPKKVPVWAKLGSLLAGVLATLFSLRNFSDDDRPRQFLDSWISIAVVYSMVSLIEAFLNLEAWLAFILAALLYSAFFDLIFVNLLSGRAGERLRSTVDDIIRGLKFQNRMVIRINLSQDDIQEDDILRLLVTNILSSYRSFNKSLRSPLLPLAGTILFVLVVCGIYGLAPIQHLNQQLKLSLHVPCFLPSQGAFLLNDEFETYKKELTDAFSISSASINEFRVRLEGEVKAEYSEGKESGRVDHLFTHPRGRTEDSPLLGVLTIVGWKISDLVVYMDSFVQLVWIRSLSHMPAEIFRGLDRQINYLLVLYLLVLYSFYLHSLNSPWFRWQTNKSIEQELEALAEMVESQVTKDAGAGSTPISTFLSISFGKKRSQTFKQLKARDIEKRLLEILSRIDDLPPFSRRPEFVVVFDELDKIHHGSTPPDPVDAKLPNGQRTLSGRKEFSSVEAERERQHKVLTLVSNLKYFLTTAKAKFIFIAGREMFDASLADVSDRHFFMGSVFHDVIHVPSFHKDKSDDRLTDLTSLTEEYVSRLVIPKAVWEGKKKRASLAMYGMYLGESQLNISDNGTQDSRIRRAVEEKVIYELNNFIVYLTYRSNGAPKKMTQSFERFVVSYREAEVDPDALIVGRSRRNLYLRFTYEDQYTFGLITYLASPLLFSLSREMKDYGDKILVSSSFLLDHIYKFHGMAFAWRNLELLPEIVDASRAPQLRGLVEELVKFLSRGDLVSLTNGIFDFKFTRKISEEISLLSRISEFEGAAFNFTLNESLSLKRHFYRKLEQLIEAYGEYPNSRVDDRYINSIAFLRMILGDLHSYDGELDNAIVEYKEAVQLIRSRISGGRAGVDLLVVMMRNFLKLGLAFERKKSHSAAFTTYGKMASVLRDVIESEEQERENRKSKTAESNLLRKALSALPIFRQPMLAQLQLLEKGTLGGIQGSDLKGVDEEFEFLCAQVEGGRVEVKAEFDLKVGNMVFFKNGPSASECGESLPHCLRSEDEGFCIPNRGWEKLSQETRLPCMACERYRDAVVKLRDDACDSKYGMLVFPRDLDTLEVHSSQALRTHWSEHSASLLASALSLLGDCYLSCSYLGRRDVGGSAFHIGKELVLLLDAFLARAGRLRKRSPRSSDPGGHFADRVERLNGFLRDTNVPKLKILEAVSYYLASAEIRSVMGAHREAGIEITKVLWVVRESISLARTRETLRSSEQTLKAVRNSARDLASWATELAYRCHGGTHRLEIERLKEIWLESESALKEAPRRKPVNLGRISLSTHLDEVFVLQEEIKVLLASRCDAIRLDERASPFGMYYSAYSRIQVLRLRLSRRSFRVSCGSDCFGPQTDLAGDLAPGQPAVAVDGRQKQNFR